MTYATLIKRVKIGIYITMFILGGFLGYLIFVLHWFTDYIAPTYQAPTTTQYINIHSGNGFTCYTVVTQQQYNYSTKTKCDKQ